MCARANSIKWSIHAQTHTHTRTLTHVHTHTENRHAYTNTDEHPHTHIRTRPHTHAYTHTHTHTHTNARTHINTRTHAHTHISLPFCLFLPPYLVLSLSLSHVWSFSRAVVRSCSRTLSLSHTHAVPHKPNRNIHIKCLFRISNLHTVSCAAAHVTVRCMCRNVLQRLAVQFNELQCVTCVAMCCSGLQCVAVRCTTCTQ